MAIDPRLLYPGLKQYFEFINKEETKMTQTQRKTGNKANEKEEFILTGKAFWPHVRTPSKNTPQKYTMDLSIDEQTAKVLEQKGVTVKHESECGEGVNKGKRVGTPDDRGTFVTLAQAVYKKDGTLMTKPLVIDGKKNPVPENVKIGNGSLVNVKTSVWDWKPPFKGRSLNLGTIQLKTLVKYEKSGLDAFPEEEFTYEGGTTTANANDELDFSDNFDNDAPFE